MHTTNDSQIWHQLVAGVLFGRLDKAHCARDQAKAACVSAVPTGAPPSLRFSTLVQVRGVASNANGNEQQPKNIAPGLVASLRAQFVELLGVSKDDLRKPLALWHTCSEAVPLVSSSQTQSQSA